MPELRGQPDSRNTRANSWLQRHQLRLRGPQGRTAGERRISRGRRESRGCCGNVAAGCARELYIAENFCGHDGQAQRIRSAIRASGEGWLSAREPRLPRPLSPAPKGKGRKACAIADADLPKRTVGASMERWRPRAVRRRRERISPMNAVGGAGEARHDQGSAPGVSSVRTRAGSMRGTRRCTMTHAATYAKPQTAKIR